MIENTVQEIKVSGLICYPGPRWREAILKYVFGIWGDEKTVTLRPHIAFGDIHLRLDTTKGEYYAYGTSTSKFGELPEGAGNKNGFVVNSQQNNVECGLIRFVKNKKIELLVINFPDKGVLFLWKGKKRNEFYVTAKNIL